MYLCLRKTRAGKSQDYRNVIVSKSTVFKMFSVQRFQILKFLPFEERFRKAPLNFSGVVWVGPPSHPGIALTWVRACFSKGPETYRARKAIFSSTVSKKNVEV